MYSDVVQNGQRLLEQGMVNVVRNLLLSFTYNSTTYLYDELEQE